MAKPELGTKRTCPDTGKRFYDLNKKTIASPYTQNSWPLSYFETTPPPEEADEISALEEEKEVKVFTKHPAIEGEENIISKEDDSSLDMKYVQEIDLDDDDHDDFLEQADDDADSDVV
ncbi:TIGR02300 family protein [Candidatus Liberibacter solanacearum]|uniref:TIGR02300 family protein n=1 Tax=Candidatus Liberibacter solanacearum TaxID=556287 RepID=A0A3R7QMX7_9HYPH|nr:TIGR02300 family protein [Candidatus Liberibacter solanacearum]RPD37565.1 TIGR02300 family protein [Candidatus Liberibacter solanacearum]